MGKLLTPQIVHKFGANYSNCAQINSLTINFGQITQTSTFAQITQIVQELCASYSNYVQITRSSNCVQIVDKLLKLNKN